MNPRLVVILPTFMSLLVLLQACTGAPINNMSQGGIATPIPPYVATDQASALQARATLQASQGRLVELAAESTAVVLRMTAAAATEEYLARQTEQAQAATSTSAQAAVEGTATAQAATYTASALQAAGTATQSAYQVQGTSTAIALGLLQASATAEAERIAEQRRSEQQTLLFRTWAGRFALVTSFALLLFIAWRAANWALLRYFGVHRLVNRPVVITPNGKGGFNIFDISRSLHPGASVSNSGEVLTAGGAADMQIQNQVTARAQAGEMILAAGSTGSPRTRMQRNLVRQALQTGQPQALPPGEEVIDAEVTILPPDDPRVRPLLDEVEPKLLNGGEQA